MAAIPQGSSERRGVRLAVRVLGQLAEVPLAAWEPMFPGLGCEQCQPPIGVLFFVDRIEKQRDAADELLQGTDEGEIAAIVPQFAVFEMTYVLRSQCGITGDRVASVIRDVIAFPGVQVIDDCPWKRVMEV